MIPRCKSAAGRSVAELTAAHWSQLLASLGRTETLARLFEETKGWQWQNTEWQDLFRQSADGYYTMRHYPGVSYRCGTFALANIAKVWQPTNYGALRLIDLPSPSNGFPMSALAELAAINGLGLRASSGPRREEFPRGRQPRQMKWPRKSHRPQCLA